MSNAKQEQTQELPLSFLPISTSFKLHRAITFAYPVAFSFASPFPTTPPKAVPSRLEPLKKYQHVDQGHSIVVFAKQGPDSWPPTKLPTRLWDPTSSIAWPNSFRLRRLGYIEELHARSHGGHGQAATHTLALLPFLTS